ncbi:MAG: ATP-binding protein [Candidatus Aquicultorales bacterium]
MAFTIAVAGKGGVGKTSMSALIIRELLGSGKKPVLAVDADANVNLNEALGVEVEDTIGSVREEMLNEVRSLPSGMSKEAFVELKIQESLIEAEGFDLLVMGRPEGPGCYCYANNILRRYIDLLAKSYPYIVIDNEAGMEHLSRRTTQNIDIMLVVTDPSRVGVLTAKRIWELALDLKLNIKDCALVLNRVSGLSSEEIQGLVDEVGIPLGAVIPLDETLIKYAVSGRPLLQLDEESPAAKAVGELLDRHATSLKQTG